MPVKNHNEDANSPPRRGVIAVCVRAGELLVIQRSRHVVAPGAFCFPGGAIEPGETQQQALVRELDEELAAVVEPQRRLWQSRTEWGVELHWWLASLTNPEQLRANPQEVAAYHWLPPDSVRELSGLLSSNVAFLKALKSGVFTLDES